MIPIIKEPKFKNYKEKQKFYKQFKRRGYILYTADKHHNKPYRKYKPEVTAMLPIRKQEP